MWRPIASQIAFRSDMESCPSRRHSRPEPERRTMSLAAFYRKSGGLLIPGSRQAARLNVGHSGLAQPLISADGVPLGLKIAGFAGEKAGLFAVAATLRDLLASARLAFSQSHPYQARVLLVRPSFSRVGRA